LCDKTYWDDIIFKIISWTSFPLVQGLTGVLTLGKLQALTVITNV